MNSVIEEILKKGVVRSKEGQEFRIYPMSVTETEGAFIQEVMRKYKPATCLEIGLAYGLSSLYISTQLKGTSTAKHIIIDGFQKSSFKNIGLDNLEKAGCLGHVEFHEALSQEALPQLSKQGIKVDFVFIDGRHDFDYFMNDFFYVDKLLNVGGVAMFDDADFPSIRKACRYILRNLNYKVILSEANPPHYTLTKKEKWVKRLFGIPWLGAKLKNNLKPELSLPDYALNLFGSCIALEKTGEDTRGFDFHVEF